jgi:hypothetical protein
MESTSGEKERRRYSHVNQDRQGVKNMVGIVIVERHREAWAASIDRSAQQLGQINDGSDVGQNVEMSPQQTTTDGRHDLGRQSGIVLPDAMVDQDKIMVEPCSEPDRCRSRNGPP